MPFDPIYLLFFIAWFAGGFVHGVSGMGGAMVALPIVAGAMDARLLIPACCFCIIFTAGTLAVTYRRFCRWRSMRSMFCGSIPGALAGVSVLLVIPASGLQLAAGSVMLAFVIWQFAHGPSKAHGDSWLAGGMAGFFSAFVNTSIGFGNPPVGIYALYAGWNQLETMGTMNVFVSIVTVMTIATHAAAGLYNLEVFKFVGFGAAGTFAGILVSMPVARRIRQDVFRRLLLMVIGCAGLVCLSRGLAAW